MFILVYRAWNGDRAEIHYNEEEVKERYSKLKKLYSEIHLLPVDKEIKM